MQPAPPVSGCGNPGALALMRFTPPCVRLSADGTDHVPRPESAWTHQLCVVTSTVRLNSNTESWMYRKCPNTSYVHTSLAWTHADGLLALLQLAGLRQGWSRSPRLTTGCQQPPPAPRHMAPTLRPADLPITMRQVLTTCHAGWDSHTVQLWTPALGRTTFQAPGCPSGRAMCPVAAGKKLAFCSTGGRVAGGAQARGTRANNGGRRGIPVATGVITRGASCGGP